MEENRMESQRDVIIIGGGPAGLAAALYASRAGLSTLVLESQVPGGQIATTDQVENYPGVGPTTGPELAQGLLEDALRFGAQLRSEEVEDIEIQSPFRVKTPGGHHEGRALIVATGARPMTIGVPGEDRLRGKGVSYCATCDAAFFRGEDIAVVGGGNSAIQEALFLARIARKVTVIHRRDQLRAVRRLADRARETENIEFVWDTVVSEMRGDNQLEGLRLQNVKTGEHTDLSVQGLFVYVGTFPNTEFLPPEIRRDDRGYLPVDENLMTSVPGIFAAGDVRPKKLRQVVTATGDGAEAATAALEYLEGM